MIDLDLEKSICEKCGEGALKYSFEGIIYLQDKPTSVAFTKVAFGAGESSFESLMCCKADNLRTNEDKKKKVLLAIDRIVGKEQPVELNVIFEEKDGKGSLKLIGEYKFHVI